MSDVKNDAGDINRKSTRNKDETAADENTEDFEGHKKGHRGANDEDTGDDFEGHKKGGRV